jgi:hypothetical protein
MGLVETVAPAVGVWVVVAPLCAPLLLAERVRVLFTWPTASLSVNYLLVSCLVATGHYLTFLAATVAQGGHLDGHGILWTAGTVIVGYPLALWAGASVGLPALGRWEPAGEGVDGRLILAVGAVGYVVAVGIAFAFLFTVAVFAAFPG